eukprot:1600554-Pyramimonas_sp.AAC.1
MPPRSGSSRMLPQKMSIQMPIQLGPMRPATRPTQLTWQSHGALFPTLLSRPWWAHRFRSCSPKLKTWAAAI